MKRSTRARKNEKPRRLLLCTKPIFQEKSFLRSLNQFCRGSSTVVPLWIIPPIRELSNHYDVMVLLVVQEVGKHPSLQFTTKHVETFQITTRTTCVEFRITRKTVTRDSDVSEAFPILPFFSYWCFLARERWRPPVLRHTAEE